jgi:hypothetical protein
VQQILQRENDPTQRTEPEFMLVGITGDTGDKRMLVVLFVVFPPPDRHESLRFEQHHNQALRFEQRYSESPRFEPRPSESPKPTAQRSRTEAQKPESTEPKEALPHEVLGVPANASQAEIKTAYRELALRYHPDKARQQGEEVTENDIADRTESMKKINAAYKQLIAPTSGQ